MKQILLVFLQLSIIVAPGYTQHPEWINYTTGKNINCIYNDGNYLWLGTTGGLARFDKTTGISNFYTKHNSGLPGLNISALTKANNGNLCVGTQDGGVAIYDGNTWTVYNQFNSGLSQNYVTDICFDNSGALWVGTFTAGLDKFYNGTWTNYKYPQVSSGVEALAIDSSGVLYIGSSNDGLIKYDGVTWTHYTTLNSGLLNNRIHDIKIDSHNNVWACSYNCGGPGGLSKFDGTSFTSYLVYTSIEKICLDSAENIWFINNNTNGLSKFDGTNVVHYASGNSQIINPNYALIEDSGSIYYSSRAANGLNKFDGSFAVTTYDPSAYQIASNFISGVSADNSGNLWISHFYKGLDKYDQTTFTHFDTLNSGLPVNNLDNVAVDPISNTVWMGTWANGIVKFDGINWTVFDSSSNNLPGIGTIGPAKFDGLGNTYVLFRWYYLIPGIKKAGGGIGKYDGSTWTKLSLTAIPDTLISSFGIDKLNNLWVSSPGVIEKVSGVSHTVYNSSNSLLLANDNIMDFAFDNLNNIYGITQWDKIYKINAAMQFSSFPVTNCNPFPMLFTDILSHGCIDISNKLWTGIANYCSDSSDYLVANHDGVSASFYGLNNSGMAGDQGLTQIYNFGNKIYFAGYNGLTEYTDPTISLGINNGFLAENNHTFFYPNPVQNVLTVSDLDDHAELFMYDVIGKLILTAHLLKTTNEINVETLPGGIYFVETRYADGRLKRQKVMKM